MIHSVRYICPTDGFERHSNVVRYENKIHYNINPKLDGYVGADSYCFVSCACGENHKFLLATASEHL